MGTFKDYITEGKQFHPIDVFKKRFVITDGKEIFSASGEVKSMKDYKEDMKKIKKHNQYDDIYFPTEKMAEEAFKDAGFEKPLEVEELSYA